jgi:hypothetical protein
MRGQPFVDMFRPSLAPFLHKLALVPVTHLRAETVLGHFPHRQHDMRVGFGEAICAISQ